MFQSKHGPVGIDFGTRGVRLLQLREQGDGVRVSGAAKIDLPADPAVQGYAAKLTDGVRRALADGRFAGRRCFVALHRNDVHLKSIRLPKMSDEDLRGAVAWEAAERFGLDRDEAQVDYVRLGEVQQGAETREEILLIAVAHHRLAERVEPLLAAGLRPVGVDVGFLAATRCHTTTCRRAADSERVRVMLDVGASGTSIMILQGDRLAFCKTIALGGDRLDQAVAEHLQLDMDVARELRAHRLRQEGRAAPAVPERTAGLTERAIFEAVRPLLEQVVKEVGLCLRYYGVTFRGKGPEQLLLIGGEAGEARFAQMLRQTCKVPVEAGDEDSPLPSLIPAIEDALGPNCGPAASWAVAAGLSLRGLSHLKTRRATAARPEEQAA